MRLQPRFLLLFLSVVVSVHAVAAQSQGPAVNVRPGPVNSASDLPEIRVTVDQKRVPLGTQVTFTLSPADVLTDSRYVVTLYFGDREQEVMHAPQTVHLYREVGTYTYSVDVRKSPNSGSTKDSSGKDKPAQDPLVSLTPSPVSAQQNEPVDFVAQLSANYPNVQYRFVYGDSSSSDWQTSPKAQHSFSRAGNYSAYVEIRDSKQYLGGSLRKLVDIAPPLKVSVTAGPLPAQSGKPVIFVASISLPRAGTRYRFSFGDGSQSNWQDDARAQHSYRSSGRFPASVQVSQSNNSRTFTASSDPTLVMVQSNSPTTPKPASTPPSASTPSVAPTPSPSSGASPSTAGSSSPDGSTSTAGSSSPDGPPSGLVGATSPSTSPNSWPDWLNPKTSSGAWWYLLIAAALLFLIYKGTGYLFAAKPTFEPFADPGVAGVANKKNLPLDFQLVLNPNVVAGDYSVTTAAPHLISSADQIGDRQILEI